MKQKKVLVCGGAGFIGSYVTKILCDKGYEVTVTDNLSKKESTEKNLPTGCRFINIDLTDKKAALNAFRDIDLCINLASKIGGIGYFNKYPATILSENNKLYSSIFEAAAANKIKRMVYISSSMVFESASIYPSKESDLIRTLPPLTGYGFSKLIGEYYCRTFKEEFSLDYTIIRPFNAYGINEYPGDFVGYSHVIPDLIKKILSGQYPLEILGDGKQTRCFTNVKDIARGIIMAMESDKAAGEDFNIGTSEETKIIDLAKMLWKLCGKKEKFAAKLVKGYDNDISRRVPDISKAKKILGWEPEIALGDGVSEVFAWLKQELNYIN